MSKLISIFHILFVIGLIVLGVFFSITGSKLSIIIIIALGIMEINFFIMVNTMMRAIKKFIDDEFTDDFWRED